MTAITVEFDYEEFAAEIAPRCARYIGHDVLANSHRHWELGRVIMLEELRLITPKQGDELRAQIGEALELKLL